VVPKVTLDRQAAPAITPKVAVTLRVVVALMVGKVKMPKGLVVPKVTLDRQAAPAITPKVAVTLRVVVALVVGKVTMPKVVSVPKVTLNWRAALAITPKVALTLRVVVSLMLGNVQMQKVVAVPKVTLDRRAASAKTPRVVVALMAAKVNATQMARALIAANATLSAAVSVLRVTLLMARAIFWSVATAPVMLAAPVTSMLAVLLRDAMVKVTKQARPLRATNVPLSPVAEKTMITLATHPMVPATLRVPLGVARAPTVSLVLRVLQPP
jgi:hypothetical protein